MACYRGSRGGLVSRVVPRGKASSGVSGEALRRRPKPDRPWIFACLLLASCLGATLWALIAVWTLGRPEGNAPIPVTAEQDYGWQLVIAWFGTMSVMIANFPAWYGMWRAWVATEAVSIALLLAWFALVGPF